jgi:hypothetical protein
MGEPAILAASPKICGRLLDVSLIMSSIFERALNQSTHGRVHKAPVKFIGRYGRDGEQVKERVDYSSYN